MSELTPPFKIEPMTLADIPAVVAIEHVSYSMTWPAKAYDYELQKNEYAHYFVLRTSLSGPPQSDIAFPDVWAVDDALGGQAVQDNASVKLLPIIGLAGFWLMADEVHVSTIAVHPDWRGLGLGEWLLWHLIEQGQNMGAQVATLEVRPSNHAALALYDKYRFEEVGRRRHYYSDNNEDALILTTPALTTPDYQAMLEQRRVALFHRLANL
jgi:[ribosomal protein S18]-alanine N-acetyltransferase